MLTYNIITMTGCTLKHTAPFNRGNGIFLNFPRPAQHEQRKQVDSFYTEGFKPGRSMGKRKMRYCQK